jgi:L-asparaginase II
LRYGGTVYLATVRQLELDVVVTRGGAVESSHRVHAAIVGDGDRLLGAARNHQHQTYWRSCAKPFQVMPFVQAGGLDELGWGADQIAIACASHGGEPEHVALVERMLADIGREEGDLACGPHEPLSQRGAKIVRECGARTTRLHNNCSGKHAAMLARAEITGWPTLTYDRLYHPVQQAVLAYMMKWTDLNPPEMWLGVDGCGVVVFGGPLEYLARAYARLGQASAAGEEIPDIIVSAMLAHPFLVAGTDRFDSILMEETGGAVLAKTGSEGMHAIAVPEIGLGPRDQSRGRRTARTVRADAADPAGVRRARRGTAPASWTNICAVRSEPVVVSRLEKYCWRTSTTRRLSRSRTRKRSCPATPTRSRASLPPVSDRSGGRGNPLMHRAMQRDRNFRREAYAVST